MIFLRRYNFFDILSAKEGFQPQKYRFLSTLGKSEPGNNIRKKGGDEVRVLILSSGDLWAGAEVMVYQLSRGLATFPELELCVVLLNRKKLANELEKVGIQVIVVDESKLSFLAIFHAIRKLVVDFSPDILHSHRYKENLLAVLASYGKKTIKLIATQHGMPELGEECCRLRAQWRTRLFFGLLSYCFDRTVLVSGEMRQLLVGSYGFSENNTAVIHNGVNVPKIVSQRPRERLVIGSAGRLFPVKDFFLMVEIAHLLIKQNDSVDFLLAGDGPQYAMLENRIKASGLQGRFKLLGHQDDMSSFFKSIDVYISTSVHEGIPMSLLEAMSHAIPVVVANVGGFPEIVLDGEQGFLIERRDKDIYADRILQLVLNRTLRLQMGISARKRIVDLFSQEAMVQNYIEIYKKD